MDLRNIDLNLLKVLDALLVELSVSKAAARLDLGQPAVSASLSKLRALFGDPLLIRQGRGMQPTPFAAALAPEIESALAKLADVFDVSAQFDPLTTRRCFSMTMTDYASIMLLPRLLELLRRQAPSAELVVRSYHSPTLSNPDWEGTDVVVAPPLGVQTGHASVALFEDEWICIADRARTDLVDPVPLDRIAREPHVVMEFQPGLPSIPLGLLEAQGIEPTVALRVPNFSLVFLAVAGSPFVALVLRRIARHYAAFHSIRSFDLARRLPRLAERLYWSHRTDRDPALKWFRGLIQEAARSVD